MLQALFGMPDIAVLHGGLYERHHGSVAFPAPPVRSQWSASMDRCGTPPAKAISKCLNISLLGTPRGNAAGRLAEMNIAAAPVGTAEPHNVGVKNFARFSGSSNWTKKSLMSRLAWSGGCPDEDPARRRVNGSGRCTGNGPISEVKRSIEMVLPRPMRPLPASTTAPVRDDGASGSESRAGSSSHRQCSR